jgi:hypothetical protein
MVGTLPQNAIQRSVLDQTLEGRGQIGLTTNTAIGLWGRGCGCKSRASEGGNGQDELEKLHLGFGNDEDSWMDVLMCCYANELIKIDKLFCRQERAR